MKKNNIIFALIIVAALVLVSFSFTYAYFTAKVEGNDDPSNVHVDAGYLDLNFQTENEEYINNLSGKLIKDENVDTEADATTFTVSHKARSTGPAIYELRLTSLSISDNLKSNDFKWQLLKGNSIVNNGTFATAKTGTDIILTKASQTLNKDQTDTYTFRIWLSETDEDQSDLYNGTFSAKIAISAKSGS